MKFGGQEMEISGLIITMVIYSGEEKPRRAGVGVILNKKWGQ